MCWGGISPARSRALGEGVSDFQVGDAVFGVCRPGQEGTYAEKIAIKAAIVAKKPDGLSHVNAAALALTGLTAMNSVEDTLKLKRGETILIQGGAGGVAGFAIQFAKHIGARVISTASTREPRLRALPRRRPGDRLHARRTSPRSARRRRGVRDRRRRRGGEILRGAQARRPRRLHRLRRKGAEARAHRRAGAAAAGRRAPAPLERIAALFLQGAVRAPEVKLYRLSEAADAHRVSEGRHLRGKLVFQVR